MAGVDAVDEVGVADVSVLGGTGGDVPAPNGLVPGACEENGVGRIGRQRGYRVAGTAVGLDDLVGLQ